MTPATPSKAHALLRYMPLLLPSRLSPHRIFKLQAYGSTGLEIGKLAEDAPEHLGVAILDHVVKAAGTVPDNKGFFEVRLVVIPTVALCESQAPVFGAKLGILPTRARAAPVNVPLG